MEKKSANDLILVTGGARGLGLSLVEDCLRNGSPVATCSRRLTKEMERLLSSYPDQLSFAQLDISDSEATNLWVQSAIERFGEVFAVVHNAAVAQEGLLATLPEVEIDRMLDIDLRAILKLNRLVIRSQLRANRGGRILSISSIIAQRGYTGLSVYAAAKAGLEGMTRALARELGARNITVNCVAPGYMRSDMSAGLQEAQLQQIIRRTPLGRLAEFGDVVPTIRFLLSPDARFITGQTVVIDGGITV